MVIKTPILQGLTTISACTLWGILFRIVSHFIFSRYSTFHLFCNYTAISQLRTEYEYELTKYYKMTEQLDNKYQVQAKKSIDIRSRVKYVVENGARKERIRLLKNLGSKVYLKNRDIYLG